MTPRKAVYPRDIYGLRSDNHSTKQGWIALDGGEVTICAQRPGELPRGSTGTVSLSRRDFNALVDWYNRPQKLRRK